MSSTVRDSIMAIKLKDGIQDALVYLRLLEGAKLAPVYEKKRIQLMNKLLDLQGDTRKEAPPKFDSDTDEEDEENPLSPKSEDSPKKQPADVEKRNSKILEMTKNFSQPSKPTTYRYKTLEELKRERELKKAGISIETETETDSKEDSKESSVVAPDDTNDTKTEEEAAATAVEEVAVEEAPVTETQETQETPYEETQADTKGKQHRKSRSHTLGTGLIGKLGKKLKGKGKERSLTVGDVDTMDNISQASENEIVPNATSEAITEQSEDVPELTEEDEMEGFHLSSQLERVTRRFGKYIYHKVNVTLSNDTVTIMKPKDKEGTHVSLVGAATAIRDSYSFELHTVDKSYTFQTESEDLCVKWVDTLKLAIDTYTPEPETVEETIEEPLPTTTIVPEITVSASDIKDEPPTPTDYVNVQFDNKKKRPEMPEPSTLKVQGYMFKKGTFGGWDKVWVVMTTSNTIFMSANESSKKVIQTFQVDLETKIEKKKGSDKYPHGVTIMAGKAKETLATDSKSDYSNWIDFLEGATGSAEIQELLSEDEDAGDLYEELGTEVAPVVPASPRPTTHTFSSAPIEEEIYDDFEEGGDEIYEGLDDIDIPPPQQSQTNRPSLPPRNEPKVTPMSSTPPTLPPRNQPPVVETAPALPPRPGMSNNTPMDYEAPSPSPLQKHTPAVEENEDVYDDIVGAQGSMGGGQETEEYEETYDDIANTMKPQLSSKVSTGDLYEDMAPQEYVTMEPPLEQEEYTDMVINNNNEVEELYVDVEESPPPRPPPPSSSIKIPSRPMPPATVPSRSSPPASVPSRPAPPGISKLAKQTSDDIQKSSPKTPPLGNRSATLPSTVRPTSSASKVANLSKKFGDTASTQSAVPKNKRGTYSNTIQYMGLGKVSYNSEWAVLEGNTIIFYKGPNEKLSSSRLNLREAELILGSPDAKSQAPFAFHIKKGQAVHKFSTNSAQELAEWIGPIAKVIQKVSPAPDTLYQALDDHKSTQEGEVSFKKGDIIWVLSQDTPTIWAGAVATSVGNYTGNSGSFPSAKVDVFTPNEDLYI